MIRVIIIALCFVTVDSLYEGDQCIHNRTKSNGICKKIPECQDALNDLKAKRSPQTCGFNEGMALACCPTNKPIDSRFANVPKPTRKTTTEKYDYDDGDDDIKECAYPPNAITINENEYPQKSWKKCIELADSVFPCASRSLLPGAIKMRIDTCQRSAAQLIINGIKAEENEFPHMAALGYNNQVENKIDWDCGGSLVSEQWILTAAHCLYSKKTLTEVSLAIIGEIDLRKNTKFMFNIIERIKHPEYTVKRIYNDIALVKIDKSVTYSEKIRPACLHVGNSIKDDNAIAIGFGLTRAGDPNSKSDKLMKVKLNKFTKEECSRQNPAQKRSPNGIIDSQLCYGSASDSNDTCSGDSGGPLQIANTGVHCTYTVIGVTSVGKICGSQGYPALYTKVSSHIQWIESVVWPN